jgi:predicted DNA-binding protein
MIPITIDLQDDLYARLVILSTKRGKPTTSIICHALSGYLKRVNRIEKSNDDVEKIKQIANMSSKYVVKHDNFYKDGVDNKL